MGRPNKTTRSSVSKTSTGPSEGSNSASVPSSTSKFADKWTEEELDLVVNAWKNHKPPMPWTKILKEVKELDPSFPRTPASIRTKIRSLQRTYMDAKKKGLENAPYFHIFDEAFGELPIIKMENDQTDEIVNIESDSSEDDTPKRELGNRKRKVSQLTHDESDSSEEDSPELEVPIRKHRASSESDVSEVPSPAKLPRDAAEPQGTEKVWSPRETEILVGCWVHMKQSPEADPGLLDVEADRDFWKLLIQSIQDRMPKFQRTEEQCQERIKEIVTNYRQSKGDGRRLSTTFKLLDKFFARSALPAEPLPQVAVEPPVNGPENCNTAKPTVSGPENRNTAKPTVNGPENRNTAKPAVNGPETQNTAKPTINELRGDLQNFIGAFSTFAEKLLSYMEH